MSYMLTVLMTATLLMLSNVFMTFAWYGHLNYKSKPLFGVILVSWGIAFFEYCFQVPANRFGHAYLSAVELKTLQEVITLVVFVVFSVTYLGESLRWNHYLGLMFITLGAYSVFYK